MWDAYWRLREEIDPQFEGAVGRPVKGHPGHSALRRRWLALRDAAEPFRRLSSPVMRGPGRIRGAKRALFWFRPSAGWPGIARGPGTVVLDARALAGQMARWGIAIREIAIRQPGVVLWEDHQQVLAIPEGPVPRAFGRGSFQ